MLCKSGSRGWLGLGHCLKKKESLVAYNNRNPLEIILLESAWLTGTLQLPTSHMPGPVKDINKLINTII